MSQRLRCRGSFRVIKHKQMLDELDAIRVDSQLLQFFTQSPNLHDVLVKKGTCHYPLVPIFSSVGLCDKFNELCELGDRPP